MRSTLDVFQTVFDVLFQTDFTLDEYSLLQTVKQMPKNQCVFVLASLREKCPKYEVISGPYFCVFSPNTAKYGPEITPYLDTFHTVFSF